MKVPLKDVIYWSIIVFILFGASIIFRWKDESELANQMSLISAWVSIALAFTAIFYAFYQTSVNKKDSEEMTKNVTLIKSEIESIEKISESLKQLDTKVSSIKENNEITRELFEANREVFDQMIRGSLDNVVKDDIEINRIVNEITEGFFEETDNYNKEINDVNGAEEVRNFISELPNGSEITYKQISRKFKETLSTGQIAGGVKSLHENGTLKRIGHGRYVVKNK